MPRYSYICNSCKNQLEAFHSIDERLSFCDICNTESLSKLLTIPNIVKKQDTNSLTNRKKGDIVKEKIDEFKKDLKEQKRELLNRKS